MSNKKKNSSKSSSSHGAKAKRAVVAAASRANPKTLKLMIIAATAVILIAAILLGVLYFTNPDLLYKMFGIDRNPTGGGNLPGNVEGDRLQVNFVNVGQGDCILIKFPDGKTMIIDAGGNTLSSGMTYSSSIEKCIEEMEITKFDYLMLTHTDADHVNYMDDIVTGYDVGTIYRPAYLSNTEVGDSRLAKSTNQQYDKFVIAARNEGATVINNVGKLSFGGDGYQMDIYCPPITQYYTDTVGNELNAYESNIISPICELKYGGRSVVFTGDAESNDNGGNGAEELFYKTNYPNTLIDCDVLKVGHHGSRSAASIKFLQFIDPEYAVISVGKNTHGHPSAEALNKLSSYRDLNADDDYNGIAHTYITRDDGRVLLTIGANGGMEWDTLMY